jgi:hypothetical protein
MSYFAKVEKLVKLMLFNLSKNYLGNSYSYHIYQGYLGNWTEETDEK